jgi:hypothetical protein
MPDNDSVTGDWSSSIPAIGGSAPSTPQPLPGGSYGPTFGRTPVLTPPGAPQIGLRGRPGADASFGGMVGANMPIPGMPAPMPPEQPPGGPGNALQGMLSSPIQQAQASGAGPFSIGPDGQIRLNPRAGDRDARPPGAAQPPRAAGAQPPQAPQYPDFVEPPDPWAGMSDKLMGQAQDAMRRASALRDANDPAWETVYAQAQKLQQEAQEADVRSRTHVAEVAKARQEHAQRRYAADLQLQAQRRADETQRLANDPEHQRMLAEAKRRSDGLSPTAQKELFEAEDTILATRNAVELLTKARDLNKAAFQGPTANMERAISRTWGSLTGADIPRTEATTDFQSIMTGQALESLRSVFGGNPTEGERKILLDIQASPTMSRGEREILIARAIQMAERRLAVATQKARQLRTGEYMKPGGGQTGTLPAAPATTPAAPQGSDIKRKYGLE